MRIGATSPVGVDYTLEAGVTYTFKVTITNKSTSNGMPIAVTFGDLVTSVILNGTKYAGSTLIPSLGAGETKTYIVGYWNFPTGLVGKSGKVSATLNDPGGRLIASDEASLYIR